MRNRIRHLRFAVIWFAFVVTNLVVLEQADAECCARCGCQDSCQKVCRLVCEQKKVEIVCWGCKCEDFCDPGPSKGCQNCEEVCVTCQELNDPKAPYAVPKMFSWTEWIPGCSKGIYTKKKLMKKTITKSVPSFKWVVEDLCAACEKNTPSAEIPPGAKIPPQPPSN